MFVVIFIAKILILLYSKGVKDNNFIDKENVLLLEKKIEEELSAFEKQVLDLYLTGMTYSQIARVLGRDEKSTDNALHRLKAKIRKAIDR